VPATEYVDVDGAQGPDVLASKALLTQSRPHQSISDADQVEDDVFDQPDSVPRVLSVAQRQSLQARPRRLRARRVRTEELAIGTLKVSGRHSTLGTFQGTVE